MTPTSQACHAGLDPASCASKPWRTELIVWLPIIIGLAVLYVPSFRLPDPHEIGFGTLFQEK